VRVIHLARKPPGEPSVAANALKYGCGALNIDAGRIPTLDNLNGGAYAQEGTDRWDGAENWRYQRKGEAGDFQQPSGRWPANLVLQHLSDCSAETCKPGCPVAEFNRQDAAHFFKQVAVEGL